MLAMLQEQPIGDYTGLLVPIVALIVGLGIVVAISLAIAHVKARKIEAERDMLARRLAYDQRLKELEIERLRIVGAGAGEGGAPAPPAATTSYGGRA